MRRLLPLLALLTSCSAFHAPAPSEWTSTVHGMAITWRLVTPGSIAGPPGHQYAGYATSSPLERACRVELDAGVLVRAPELVPHLAAHEVGHCMQGRFLLPGLPRPDLGPYYASGMEGWAETYALAYLAACGPSLAPLGWADPRPADCEHPPDPRTVRAAL